MEQVHIVIAMEHDGSGDPDVLVVTRSEEFASWVMRLLEKANSSKKLIKSSWPVIDPKVSEGDLFNLAKHATRAPIPRHLVASPHGG